MVLNLESEQNTSPGILYMVPVLLGEGPLTDVLPEKTIRVAASLSVFIAENAKSARQFLKRLPSALPMSSIEVLEMDKHGTTPDAGYYFEKLRSGISTGVLSEAGMPGIADPGAYYASCAHREHIRVVPLCGPSSLFLALAASGLNGQQFAFHGYLPKSGEQLAARIRHIEQQSARNNQTQLFIETPYRNQALLEKILTVCTPSTLLCLAEEVSLCGEKIRTATVSEWKKRVPDINRKQVVFLLLAQHHQFKRD